MAEIGKGKRHAVCDLAVNASAEPGGKRTADEKQERTIGPSRGMDE